MNEGEEIRFIDLFSGIGGFRLGLERVNSGLDAKLTAGKGGHQNQKGLSADSRSKDGNGRREHTDDLSAQQLQAQGRRWNEDEETLPDGYSSSPSGESRLHSAELRYRCVWSCDNNKYANQVYTKHFGEANHYTGDIRGVDPGDIPDFDLLCAGFPCQSFSVAGKRKGFQDTRGTLFFEISRIAEAKRPQMLLLENVKGLLSSDRGQTFQIILQELGRIGYWAEWQILNSKHHGVPQNRERVFIIGHLRGAGGREIFPIPEGNRVSVKKLEKVGNIAQTGHDSIWGRVYDPKGIAMNINAEGGGVGAKTGLYTIPVLTPDRPNKRQHGRRFKEDGEPAFTLTEQDRHGVMVPNIANTVDQDGYLRFGQRVKGQVLPIGFRRIRRLTPVECERLQGFPDGWTEGISDTQRYKCLGNAVTVNVITFLGKRIMEVESNG